MWTEILFAFIGALFGAALALVPAAARRLRALRSSRAARRRGDLLRSQRVRDWLLTYYARRGVALFTADINGTTTTIPVIAPDEWIFNRRLEMTADWPLTQRPAPASPPQPDMRAIRRRLRLGTKLYETSQRSLYLDVVQPDEDTLLATRPCRYFALASSLIALEDETFAGAAGGWWRRIRTPVRDRFLPGPPQAGVARPAPFSVGVLAVFAVRTSHSYEIAIQSRSGEVLTAPNAKAVIPNFGLAENELAGHRSKLGIIGYNLVKEYLEELFDYEELIGEVLERRHDPDWFLNFPEARDLLDREPDGMLTLTCLGIGIDCLSGTTTVAVLVDVEDALFGASLKKKIIANWEVSMPTPGSPPVQFIDHRDSRLSAWHERAEYQPGSAFALALALPELRRRLAGDR
ncbi:hypothetical protein AMIS_25550 [Actinoplanes missouriensis 431]|uniref:Uncharacterized protein n=1 Tax=Actinoplanes missouriensis (strain ATCC 14538 / DSM 43046 / CBS 188.64 / JCM 3121 / NBRC 102363 / NCIMB 12654 / NRRL B-3342 / UNCC 431) TaxID=512565 RepID=I0H438_ACTM4|nr:hypothetical protein [Actinoplanes missouriensis]BAL87775.1 hypothetical protein AMIS_25550 [Actinoplanes missouriensis 431]